MWAYSLGALFSEPCIFMPYMHGVLILIQWMWFPTHTSCQSLVKSDVTRPHFHVKTINRLIREHSSGLNAHLSANQNRVFRQVMVWKDIYIQSDKINIRFWLWIVLTNHWFYLNTMYQYPLFDSFKKKPMNIERMCYIWSSRSSDRLIFQVTIHKIICRLQIQYKRIYIL